MVASVGSIKDAAVELHVSQSAVSMALADLERQLGARLFARNPNGSTPTRIGERVLAGARQMLSEASDLQNLAHETYESMTGPLVVGCYTTIASVFLPRVIASFIGRYPGVELGIVEGSQELLQEQLSRRVLDLALMYDYGPVTPSAVPLSREKLFRTRPYALLPAGHPLQAQDTISLRSLARERVILFDLPPGGEYFRGVFESQGATPNVVFRTSNFETVRALVARGVGCSLLSQHTQVSTSWEGEEFLVRAIADDVQTLDVDIVTPADAHPTLRARAFIQECKATRAALPDAVV